jgi:HD-GYP domain-containing protein (c-di-GMP phosphodiesterase class II)
MHDIGKIAISAGVLDKAGKLTEAEYEELKRHSEVGYHILKSVDAYTNLADYVLSHHEMWDGTGYPRGISGEGIPLIARIIAVADAYEAMIGDRPYRNSMNPVEAMEEIRRCAGTQFDPNVVDVFSAMQASL